MQYRSPAAQLIAFSKRMAAYKGSVKDGHAEIVTDTRDIDWPELTSGTISTVQLRRMGHPFARGRSKKEARLARAFAKQINGIYAGRRRGIKAGVRGKAPLSPLNKQSGTLQESLVIEEVSDGHYRLESSAEYWSYLDTGTDSMVARPIAKELIKRYRARLNGLLSRTSY